MHIWPPIQPEIDVLYIHILRPRERQRERAPGDSETQNTLRRQTEKWNDGAPDNQIMTDRTMMIALFLIRPVVPLPVRCGPGSNRLEETCYILRWEQYIRVGVYICAYVDRIRFFSHHIWIYRQAESYASQLSWFEMDSGSYQWPQLANVAMYRPLMLNTCITNRRNMQHVSMLAGGVTLTLCNGRLF